MNSWSSFWNRRRLGSVRENICGNQKWLYELEDKGIRKRLTKKQKNRMEYYKKRIGSLKSERQALRKKEMGLLENGND